MTLAACTPPQAVKPSADPVLREESNERHVASLRHAARTASISLELADATTRTMRTRACSRSGGNMDVERGTESYCIRCTLAKAETLAVGAGLLAEAMSVYPDSFLRAAGLDKLTLCTLLLTDGEGVDRKAAGTVDHDDGRLLLDVGVPDGFIEYAFHHEIYHLFDRATSSLEDELEWERLNREDFRYVDSGANVPHELEPGFISDYAKTNAHEDRAEMFRYVVASADYLCAEAADDPILLAKGRSIRARVERAIPAEDARRMIDAPCLDTPTNAGS